MLKKIETKSELETYLYQIVDEFRALDLTKEDPTVIHWYMDEIENICIRIKQLPYVQGKPSTEL